jgi:zinc transport system substrate-binding protein
LAFEPADGRGALGARRPPCYKVIVKTRIVTIIVIGAVPFVLAATIGAAETRRVVAAFYPVAYAAQQIGGPSVTVQNLTPAGAEPHDLELRPSDAVSIQRADLVLYLGKGFQPAVEKAVRSTHAHGVDLLAGVRLRTGRDEQGHPALDTHVWLDPMRYAEMASRIGSALGRPRATTAFLARLRALDAQYRAGLAHCQRRTIVTSHAAFGYLAARYRLVQLALEGLSPEAEPSPKALAKLIDEVRRSHATTVFFETLVSPKLAETVARDAHVRTAVLDPIEGLTPDAVSRGATYFTVMRANLATLRLALGC